MSIMDSTKIMKTSIENLFKSRYGTLLMLICFIVVISSLITLKDKIFEQPPKPAVSMHYNGFFPHRVHYSFKQAPKRVIVLRPEIADTLIRLGAGDCVIAAYISPERRIDIPYYKKYMPNAELLYKDLTREQAVIMEPDFIIGWNGGFDFKRLGSTDYWNDRNVHTYVEENSGAMPDPYPPFKKKNFPPFSVENEIQFIRNMGILFHKESAAEREVEKITTALAQVQKLAKEKGPREVLTMQFRRGQVEVLGNKTLSGDIIRKMGCTNFDYEGLLMPLENFLMTDVESFIVIYDYVGGPSSLKNQLEMLHQKPYVEMSAVKNHRLGAIQYFDGLIATNVHTADTIWEIYRAIYEPSLEDKLQPRRSPMFFDEIITPKK